MKIIGWIIAAALVVTGVWYFLKKTALGVELGTKLGIPLEPEKTAAQKKGAAAEKYIKKTLLGETNPLADTEAAIAKGQEKLSALATGGIAAGVGLLVAGLWDSFTGDLSSEGQEVRELNKRNWILLSYKTAKTKYLKWFETYFPTWEKNNNPSFRPFATVYWAQYAKYEPNAIRVVSFPTHQIKHGAGGGVSRFLERGNERVMLVGKTKQNEPLVKDLQNLGFEYQSAMSSAWYLIYWRNDEKPLALYLNAEDIPV